MDGTNKPGGRPHKPGFWIGRDNDDEVGEPNTLTPRGTRWSYRPKTGAQTPLTQNHKAANRCFFFEKNQRPAVKLISRWSKINRMLARKLTFPGELFGLACKFRPA